MSDELLFLGETTAFWAELRRRANELDVKNLIRDLAELQAKVGFYERELDRINQFREAMKKP